MTITISKRILLPIFTLLIGFVLGINGTSPSNAETTVTQGEILTVCINLKTGAIRVSSKCDTKNERKTVLGGVGAQGPQGEIGETGPQGLQGPQGFQGLTGEAGSLIGLKTQTLDFLNGGSFFGCPGSLFGTSATVLTGALVGSYGLTTYKKTLQGCSVKVYTP